MIRWNLMALFRRPRVPQTPPPWRAALLAPPEMRGPCGLYTGGELALALGLPDVGPVAAAVYAGDMPAAVRPWGEDGPAVWTGLDLAALRHRLSQGWLRAP